MILKTDMRFKRLEPTGSTHPQTAGSLYGVVGGELFATLQQVARLKGVTLNAQLATFHQFTDGITEATVKLGKEQLLVAVVHGGKAMAEMFKRLKSGKKTYDIIEFNDTFGGLITGGGQPIVSEEFLFGWNLARMRTSGYLRDYKMVLDNPFVTSTYQTTLQEPGSPIARKMFATSFSKKTYTRK
jgi:iron only hydrogenase large subunit-like protein